MDFLILILAISIFGIFLYSPKGKGWLAERMISIMLGKSKPNKKYKINNFTFQHEDKTVQIDHIFINKNGIFLIETKNYRGRIYGEENAQNWTQVLNYGKSKFKLYNPIKQNKSHIFYLKQLLKDFNATFHSIIVLYNNTTKYIKSTTPVVSTLLLPQAIRQTQIETKLSSEQINAIYQFLYSYKSNNKIKAKTHIKNVESRLKEIENDICPRCKHKLIDKAGKFGPFVACSNFPNCKFIKK